MAYESKEYGSFLSAKKKSNINGVALLKSNSNLYIEEKFDGHRLVISKVNGIYRAMTRGGKDKMDIIPHIEAALELMELPDDTIIDTEAIVLDAEDRWAATQSELGSHGACTTAVSIIIFDIQRWAGVDHSTSFYLDRRAVVKEWVADHSINSRKPIDKTESTNFVETNVHYSRAWPVSAYESHWNRIVTTGGREGLMLKDNASNRYNYGWTKVKKLIEVDCFVIGTTKGKGKYEGMIGALEVAVYNHGTIYPIGKITSLGDLQNRAEATQLAIDNNLKFKVLTVECNEVTKDLKLRHGVFVKWYPDKLKDECLLDQLKED